MGATRGLNRITKEDQDNNGKTFQLMWMVLHLSAVAMHLGSAIYHARRVKSNERVQD